MTLNKTIKYNKCIFKTIVDNDATEIESHIFYISNHIAVVINNYADHELQFINIYNYNNNNDELNLYTFTDDFTGNGNYFYETDGSLNTFISFENKNKNVDIILFHNFIKEQYSTSLIKIDKFNFYNNELLPPNWFQQFKKWKDFHSNIITKNQMFNIINNFFEDYENIINIKNTINNII